MLFPEDFIEVPLDLLGLDLTPLELSELTKDQWMSISHQESDTDELRISWNFCNHKHSAVYGWFCIRFPNHTGAHANLFDAWE